ncbi:MAG: hypothetical protein ABI977_21175 [Acidobacteriota bacterium]
MQAYRVESTVQPEGVLMLRNLPLPEGEKVEVIILVPQPKFEKSDQYPLRGMPVIYHDPFEPAVPETDWEVYK